MVFGIRTMRYVLIGVGALLFTVSGIGTWLAIYHERYSGMTITQATAFTGGLLGLGGLIGTFGGGALSDRYHHRFEGGRIVLVVWSSVTSAVLFMVSFRSTRWRCAWVSSSWGSPPPPAPPPACAPS